MRADDTASGPLSFAAAGIDPTTSPLAAAMSAPKPPMLDRPGFDLDPEVPVPTAAVPTTPVPEAAPPGAPAAMGELPPATTPSPAPPGPVDHDDEPEDELVPEPVAASRIASTGWDLDPVPAPAPTPAPAAAPPAPERPSGSPTLPRFREYRPADGD